MTKSVRLADIAEKLGVSVVTVSKALSGKKGVSDCRYGKNDTDSSVHFDKKDF